jgi:hypothetical protein
MNEPERGGLYWTPRIISLLFAVFVSMLALDVLGHGLTFWSTIAALLMHLLPAAFILVTLAVAWRWEGVGGIAYLASGLVYLLWFGARGPWTARIVMAGPPLVIGLLFLVDWRHRSRLRSS